MDNIFSKEIIIIAGPTASGKTSVSVNLAKKMNTQIISSDSMQIYKEMDIGTAKITTSEQEGIVHHMIDIINPNEEYSVSQYCKETKKIINSLFKEKKIPIIVGGTGLYINSLMFDMDFAKTVKDDDLRIKYTNYYEKNGLDALYNLYIEKIEEKKLDDNLKDKENPKRIIRALEIIDSGENKKDFTAIKKTNDYKVNLFVLNMDRQLLYERINKRVDKMFEKGLLEEVERLLAKYDNNSQSFKGIGYKEILAHLFDKENVSIEEVKELIKRNSRRYAKRQLTWFKRYENTNWINLDNYDFDIDKITNDILSKIKYS